MTRRYLTLDEYNGSITGMQPLPAGPGDVSSPGGLGTLYHHWTKGLGGPGDVTPDVFAGTGERYPHGEYGNLYTPASHSTVNDYYHGPDWGRTQNTTLAGQPYYWMTTENGVRENFTQIPSGPQSTKIEPDASFELIEQDPIDSADLVPLIPVNKPITVQPILMMFAFLLMFIVFDFWAQTTHRFLDKIHKGADVPWTRYFLYSICATLVALLVMYLLGIPLGKLESSSLIPPF